MARPGADGDVVLLKFKAPLSLYSVYHITTIMNIYNNNDNNNSYIHKYIDIYICIVYIYMHSLYI